MFLLFTFQLQIIVIRIRAIFRGQGRKRIHTIWPLIVQQSKCLWYISVVIQRYSALGRGVMLINYGDFAYYSLLITICLSNIVYCH